VGGVKVNFIDCKSVREQILTEVKQKVAEIGEPLKLVIFQVGDDDASKVYVKNKVKTAREVGIQPEVIKCGKFIHPGDLKYLIQTYSEMQTVTGVMLQLPLPERLAEYKQELLDLIPWNKDVDGLSSESVGRLWNGRDCIAPATPSGIMRLLPDDLSGVNACIINRSNLIGKPLTKLLMDRDATVTVCHTGTSKAQLEDITYNSKLIVTGIGKANFFNSHWIEDGQTWIDCGINRDKYGDLCGDVGTGDLIFANAEITPVPGGVGLLTTASLMANVVKAYELQKRGKSNGTY
jgi:methylenetetrahydrofolate dehydrogenase (NADP+)/methenyltetrahydrofolate cyclohydrolase